MKELTFRESKHTLILLYIFSGVKTPRIYAPDPNAEEYPGHVSFPSDSTGLSSVLLAVSDLVEKAIRTLYHRKALRETQTLPAGCSKAEPKIFAPPRTPARERGTAKI